MDNSSGRSEKWSSRMRDSRLTVWEWTIECGIESSIGKGGASGVQIWDKGSEREDKVENGIEWKGKIDSWKETSLETKILLECKSSNL